MTLGLLSLPSNLFPLLLTIVVMQLAGLPLQYSTVLALNICLGIAVDDTVHFLSRYGHELALDGNRREALFRAFRVVAPVMVTSTVLMLTGFGAGLFCSIPTVRAFSLCACTALVFALASEAVVLPAILFCLAGMTEKLRGGR
jgi:predicted RND superfamily exporter protein